MKPFRRSSVVTIMAACATASAWGQAPPDIDAISAQISDEMRAKMDQLRAQTDAIRAQSETVRAQNEAVRTQSEAIRAQEDKVRAQADAARAQVEANRDQIEAARAYVDLAQEYGKSPWVAEGQFDAFVAQEKALKDMWAFAPQQMPKPTPAAAPPEPRKFMVGRGGGDGAYEAGKRALDNRRYEEAVDDFDRVIVGKSSTRIDGAYFWKAYALNKLGKRDEALASLAELQKEYPQSGWVNDAKALQVEVQQATGRPVSPESQADEDLKLIAIQALANSDPDRAVPLLEGVLNNPKAAPRLKERTLYVLASMRSDKAHAIVGRYAKGGGANPDLQLTAVRYLGSYRSADSRQILADVYASSSDVTVKREILRSYASSRDAEHLLAAAKSEPNLDLRREAIRDLSSMRDDQVATSLVSIYGSESDKNIRQEIQNALFSQGAAKQLVECARKESDLELKRDAVQKLGQMRSKEAMDYLMELLNK